MKELSIYFKSLFCKQKTADLVAIEMLEAKKAFILSEKNRMYQESMSNYLSRYTEFLEEQDE